MASRWSILLMGVALIQGILSFSPIPEMDNIDEEWVKFNERLENPNYRLPTTTKPRHYEVLLTPYLDVTPGPNIAAFTFDGEVTIYTSATQAVNQIVIHCNDLIIETLTVTYLNANGAPVDVTTPGQQFTCDPTTSFLTINTNEALNVNQEYIIKSTFKGNLQTNMRGFYRSWYRDTTGIRWMATTQFQPGHARQAFPCYDEPSFKATFDISISRLATFSPTISNMKLIADTAPGTSERVIDRFETTPKTSTYLLAFIVSNYGVVANNNNPARPFTIHARNNVGSAGNWALEVGEALLARMETYTGIPYYGEPLPSGMIMQQAAIPDFSAGAMENWGLLTYREALILYDPENSNHFYKQRVANIVAHEISHMWFGNLVTCAWWDNLWLNEGFARFYTYYLTDLVRPEMGFDTRFIVEQVHSALFSDSTDGAHPLTDPSVGSPTSVSNHFSTITYARGAAVLRMTQYLLGKETFEKALRSYLDARKFDVAEPEHLFKAFDDAAVADSALTAYNGVTIEEYFKTWSEKPGHPILTVKIDQTTGEMTVTQERFERTTGSSANPSLYHVPITWTRAGASDFSNLKPSRIMTAQVEVINRGSTDLEWVVFNKQQSGFYRVNYDDTNWILLTRALRNNYKDIHEHNRAQIVDDLFAFARAKVLTYDRILNVLSYLEFEDEYAPWLAAISGFNFAIRRLAHDNSQREELNQIIIGLSDSVVKTLGYAEPANEDFMLSLQRMYVMSFLCDVGHAGCIEAAKTNFAAWKTGTHIAPNLRPWVYCAGLRAGDATDFDFLWNKYLTENLASEQLVLLSAAGCTTDTASLNKFWNAIIAPEAADASVAIRAQDTSTAITSAVTSNEENTMKSFEWLKTHFQEFATSPVSLSTVINSIFSRLLNEQQITEARTWLNQNQVALGAAYNIGISAITTSENNVVWYEQRAAEFSSFFETGYVDQAIDSETGDGSGSGEESGESSGEESGEGSGEESGEGSGEESGEGSGEESGEGSGEESGEGSGEDSGEDDGNNSANTAILSVATLIITLAVSFLP